jgi:MFS family permease
MSSQLKRVLPEPGVARLLATGTLVDTVGKGLFMTVSAIYFTRSVGLSVREVGLGLAAAAAAGFVVSAPLGHVADRRGPREVLIAMLLLQAGAMAALVVVDSFWAFVLVLCLGAAFSHGAGAARGAVIAGALPPEVRVRTQAYLRAVTNVGISVGTVFAGVALHLDTRGAYAAVILGNAISFVAVAGILLRLPHLPPKARPASGPRLVALHDRPFLVYAALHGVLAIHYGVFTVGMPLWVTLHTNAPRWMVALLFLLNCVFVVLFQVRVSRGTEQIGPAARAHVKAGLLVGAACVLLGISGGLSVWVAAAVLIVAAVVHVLGELFQAAGAWGLSFALAPDHAQGQYQGVFGMGFSLASMIGPIAVTAVAIEWGMPGWIVLGAMFVLVGALVPPVARWAERNRPHDVVPDELTAAR